jgi:hypothetical protein
VILIQARVENYWFRESYALSTCCPPPTQKLLWTFKSHCEIIKETKANLTSSLLYCLIHPDYLESVVPHART